MKNITKVLSSSGNHIASIYVDSNDLVHIGWIRDGQIIDEDTCRVTIGAVRWCEDEQPVAARKSSGMTL